MLTELEERTFIYGGKIRDVIRIRSATNKNKIGEKDIRKLYEEMKTKNAEFCLKATNIHQTFTFKSFADDDLIMDDDYYEGKVKNPDKFKSFSDIILIVKYDNPDPKKYKKEVLSEKTKQKRAQEQKSMFKKK